MNLSHHPDDGALAAFAAGALDEGHSLVLATHLWFCPACRHAVRTCENAGGTLLERAEPVPLRIDSLEQTLNRLGTVERAGKPAAEVVKAENMPGPLSHYNFGPWRWIGLGLHWRRVDVPNERNTRVILLNAAPGARLRRHGHMGAEWTCVLTGAFRDEFGRYEAGDFDQADSMVEHSPIAEEGPHCRCLIALSGDIRLRGWMGPLLQPFLRF
jgi:putative transcriptional regulator